MWIFVGGRALPGQWPLAASSHLYANDNGLLTNVTAEVAPDLNNLGLATGALWTDIDNDGDSDLVVATEWGPVRLLVNENGRFQDQTAAANLDQLAGLVDGHRRRRFQRRRPHGFGRRQSGLNTKYTASAEHPAVLYGGDVDEDGNVDIVEAYYVGDTLYPLKSGAWLAPTCHSFWNNMPLSAPTPRRRWPRFMVPSGKSAEV